VLWAATLHGWLVAALNLAPVTLARREGEPGFASDGRHALDAIRDLRRQAAKPAPAPVVAVQPGLSIVDLMATEERPAA
jgi:hypothetical protein